MAIQQVTALTQNGNKYTPSRTGAGLGALAGFGIGAGEALRHDVFGLKTTAENAAKAIGKHSTFMQNAKAVGKAGLAGAAIFAMGLAAAKIFAAFGSVFDLSANQDRRAQADGEAVLREKAAYNA